LGTPQGRSFRDNLLNDPEAVGRVPPAELDTALDARTHVAQVDHIFKRVFG
jgi:adenylosuccinate lyase